MSKWKFDREFFYDKVRGAVFGGTLTESQVRNMDQILDALEEADVHNPWHVGAVMGTARIEVGSAMKPVREGFASSNSGAIAAVNQLYREGRIKKNYAKPDPETGLSYYGRGYPQTTWKENYLKSGQILGVGDMFVKDPDLLLQPIWAARAMVAMMKAGEYRKGKSLGSMLPAGEPTEAQIVNSRDIINGDKDKRRGKSRQTIGQEYAGFVKKFAAAVKIDFEAPVFELEVEG